jgi:formamidopyrimidine-DNA glycosylase
MDIAKVSEINQHRLLKNIGPDALSNEFNAKYLLKKITNKKCNIKTALLDQNIVGGIGNIYASEALYHSRISPHTSCYGIVNYEDSKNNMKRLVKSVKFILNKAIEAGGSTISDHRLPNGDLGYFQNEFNVYNCESKKCNRKHCSGIIKKIKQSGRSTFFCDSCQELQDHEI